MNKRIDLTEIPLNHLAREIVITFDVWCVLNETLYNMVHNELIEIEEQINEQQINEQEN